MSSGWLKHKERSYDWVLKLMLWLAINFGRSFCRLLLYPITLYYLIFSRMTKTASRNFLGRVLSRKINWQDIFHHYHYFASVFLDRVFILNDGGKDLDVNVYGKSVFAEIQGKGCLLFGSHLGSFEIVRAYGLSNLGFSPKILMNDSSTENANTILNNLNPEIARSIIQIGDPHSLLQVKEIVSDGQMVALLADRVFQNEKSVSCNFLGQEARFPSGPATLAGILNVPVILFFGIYQGGNRYDIYFEKLAGDLLSKGKGDEKGKQEWMQLYANRLEYYSRKAPFNWFNFFDYWDKH